MSILINILLVLLAFISVFLVFIVLIQKPRADSGLGTAMGGGMAEATFGAETGNVLTRGTIWLSVSFFVIAFICYLLQLHVSKSAGREANAPALPATISAPASTPAPEAAPAVAPQPAAPAPKP